jgi:hypothetical protein
MQGRWHRYLIVRAAIWSCDAPVAGLRTKRDEGAASPKNMPTSEAQLQTNARKRI